MECTYSKSEYNDEGFFVYDWMISRLGLVGGTLLVYAVIYAFCKQYGCFSEGLGYLTQKTGNTKRGVQINLKKLEKMKLIFKSEDKNDFGKYEFYARAINFNE